MLGISFRVCPAQLFMVTTPLRKVRRPRYGALERVEEPSGALLSNETTHHD